MILINGQSETQLPVTDRGLQYGDGLFETIAYRNQHLELYAEHLERLKQGCERLAIPFSDFALLSTEIDTVLDGVNNDAVVKIIITRGSGGRGYKADPAMQPTRIISLHPYPDYPEDRQVGISLTRCQHPISVNTKLTGLKHLNRLDQVLARSEWDDISISEGLMFTEQGQLIEGTMSNVFLIKGEQLLTPALEQAGIHGVMRATILKLCEKLDLRCTQTALTEADLIDADAVFVCNSLIGIWPVMHYLPAHKSWVNHAITQQLQSAIKEAVTL